MWGTLLLAVLLAGFYTLLCLWAQPNSLRAIVAIFRAQPLLIVLNALPVGLTILCLTFAFRNVFAAAALGGGVWAVLSVANRIKIEVRDEPVFPRDLGLLKEAGAAAGSYDIHWPVTVIAVVPALLVRYILWMAVLLAGIPYHSVSFANPYLKFWLVYVYVLFGLAFFFGAKTRRKYAAAVVLAAATLIFTVKLGTLRYDSGLEVLVLDVGQGQSVILKSGDEFLLADCGSGNSWLDAGDTAAQYLQSMGCKTLDYLLLTHYDADHVSGVTGLLARMDVGTILLPPDADHAGLQAVVLDAALRHDVPTEFVRSKAHITFGDTTLTVYPPLGAKEDNERGLSALAMCGTDSILITGDMSAQTEELLLSLYKLPAVDVLVAGHHGAKNATSAALLQALSPETVCISVGSNRYGHPAPSTLQRLSEQGCTVLRTDLQGTIHISLN